METRCTARRRVHPRVGGGDALLSFAKAGQPGPSPRGRGRRIQITDKQGNFRSIPAWAGETLA